MEVPVAEIPAVALQAAVVPRRAAADRPEVVAFLVLAVAACLAWAVEGRHREGFCDIC